VLIAAYLRPSLTTVALPFESMGARGVHLLAEASASEVARPVRVTAECPLVERHSV
jgi:LacI family transcriptional regulator